MSTINDLYKAYFEINRAPISDVDAASLLQKFQRGEINLPDYIADMSAKAATTTGAAVAMLAFVTGVTPTAEHLTRLKEAADAQFSYYTAMGVGNPGLGPFEAFGRSLAADSDTGFATKYGDLSVSQFVQTVYKEVYGTEPSAAAASNLMLQLEIFQKLYAHNGMPLDDSALHAKGAVLGQVIGYAFTDPAAAATTTLDEQVAVFFNKAASGDSSVFDAPLPSLLAPVEEPPSAPAPAPVFKATENGGHVTFANAGALITVELNLQGPGYIFESGGTSVTIAEPLLDSITVPAGTTLRVSGQLSSISEFRGSGTVELTDTTLFAGDLVALDAHTAGLLDASSVTSITAASVADAQLLLVTNRGVSGNKIKLADDVAVTLTDTTATGAALKAIEDATTGFVDATSVTTLTSATVAEAAQILVAHNGSSGDKISTAPGLVVTLTDTDMVSAADLNGINAATTGLVSGNSIIGISGLAADIQAVTLAARNGFALSLTGLNQITFTDRSVGGEISSGNFRNNVTVTPADVSGNYIAISSGTHGSSSLLTVDGSGLTGTNAITVNVSSLVGKSVHVTGGAGNDEFRGGLGPDTLIGGAGNDLIRGSDGDDVIDGGDGNDRLYGGENNDTINGGLGDDYIDGENGADVLTGGGGADTFHYFEPMQGGDIITDFDSDDIILVSELDFPGYGTVITRSGAGAFSDSILPDGSGYLVLYTDTLTSTTQLIADYNGNGGGYSYVVVTFAGGVSVRTDQIHFTDYS